MSDRKSPLVSNGRPGKDGMIRMVIDPERIGSIRAARIEIERLYTQALLQMGADYGQYRALRGDTSPEKRAQLGPSPEVES